MAHRHFGGWLYLLVACGWLILVAPAGAGTISLNNTGTAPSGVKIEIGLYDGGFTVGSPGAPCPPNGTPAGSVTGRPSHGTVTFFTGQRTISNANTTNCQNGVATVNIIVGYYQSESGYTGPEAGQVTWTNVIYNGSGPMTVVDSFSGRVVSSDSTTDRNSGAVAAPQVVAETSRQVAGLISARISQVITPQIVMPGTPGVKPSTPPVPGGGGPPGSPSGSPSGAPGSQGGNGTGAGGSDRGKGNGTQPGLVGAAGGFGLRPARTPVAGAMVGWLERDSGFGRSRDSGYSSRGGNFGDLAGFGQQVLGGSGLGARLGLTGGTPMENGGTALSLVDTAVGLGAGDGVPQLGLWATAGYSRLHNTLNTTLMHGPLFTLITGVDVKVSDSILAGLAVSLERVMVETKFNDGTLDSKGLGLTPYVAWVVPPDWLDTGGQLVVDGMAGYGMISTATSRDRSLGKITARYDSARFMIGSNLTYTHQLDAWVLTGRTGYTWTKQGNTHFSESDGGQVNGTVTTLGQGRVGAKAGYQWETVQPYVGAAWLYDFVFDRQVAASTQDQPKNDRDEVEATIGLTWQPADAWMGGFEISHGFFREDTHTTNFTVHLRAEF